MRRVVAGGVASDKPGPRTPGELVPLWAGRSLADAGCAHATLTHSVPPGESAVVWADRRLEQGRPGSCVLSCRGHEKRAVPGVPSRGRDLTNGRAMVIGLQPTVGPSGAAPPELGGRHDGARPKRPNRGHPGRDMRFITLVMGVVGAPTEFPQCEDPCSRRSRRMTT